MKLEERREGITQLTKEEATNFEGWKTMTYKEIAKFQLTQVVLCMPFDKFHEAVEKTIGRPVFTHEFGLNADGIADEIFK